MGGFCYHTTLNKYKEKTCKSILIIGTGNECRSQMAEGILRSLDPDLEVYSAGLTPAGRISSDVVQAMKNIGIDISHQECETLDNYLPHRYDFIITVSEEARQYIENKSRKIKKHIHFKIEFPIIGKEVNTEAKEINKTRDIIRNTCTAFYSEYLK